ARGTSALAAAVIVAGRSIGEGGAGHVRLVRLLPGATRTVGLRHLVRRIVQPRMPFRGNARRFHLAVIDDPAAAAHAAILPAPLLVVAVSELVRADMLTLPPGEQPGSDRCHRSCALQCLREKRAGLWRSPPATSSPTAVAHI